MQFVYHFDSIRIDVPPVLGYDPYAVLPTEPVDYYFSGASSSFTISEQYDIKTSTAFLNDGYELLWVHNGTRLDLNNPHYNASLSLETETLRLTLEILNFTNRDAGFYIGVVNSRVSTMLSYFGCSDMFTRLRVTQVPLV